MRKTIILACLCGTLVACENVEKKAALKLTEKGYPVRELTGGFKAWKKQDFDIVKDSADMG